MNINILGFDTSSIAYMVLCVSCFVSVLRRLNRLDKSAVIVVRLAYTVMAGMLAMSFLSVAVRGALWFESWEKHNPTWVEVGLLLGFLMIQVATMRLWHRGYPKSFASSPMPLGGVERRHS